MATVSFNQFLPEVLPHVPGCADFVATNAIRNAAIEFCNGSMFWQETQDPFTVTSADLPYDLEAPAGARVAQILAMIVDGTPIDPISIDELDTKYLDWRNQTSTVTSNYVQPNPNQFSLFPLPQATVTLTLRVGYTPTRTATGIDEYVYQTQLEGIAAGALGRLLVIPSQAWTNPQLGEFYRKKFMQAIVDASVEANKSFNRAAVVVQPRRFA